MRLWTLHPRYLDSRGLVALWREALLAQAVLAGKTRGYTRHPQLNRFRDSPSPLAAMGSYLHHVQTEATRRNYRFDASRILPDRTTTQIVATDGQIDYEWAHLVAKLRGRDPEWLKHFAAVTRPDPHPLFSPTPGAVAAWENRSPHPGGNQRALAIR